MQKYRRRESRRTRHTPHLILSNRRKITGPQIDAVLRSYAARLSPKAAARASGLSVNTVYVQYHRIRLRLFLARYYTEGVPSLDEPGLSPELIRMFKMRKGIRPDEIDLHTAEIADWIEEFPPRIVLKHIRKIIDLTGPLDETPELTELQLEKLQAYLRYARTELIYEQRNSAPTTDDDQQYLIDRAKIAKDGYWRDYRAASKRWERSR